MDRVYPASLRVLPAFIRAASLHIGAAAAAVSLRRDLVQTGVVSYDDFSRCFAIARLTPGTNLLALYAALGYRIAGWRGAAMALFVGTIAPAALTAAIAMLYVINSTNALVSRFMSGAKAGALAVLVWGVVRLVWPVLQQYRGRAIGVGVGALALAISGTLSPFFVLVIAAVVGVFILR
jgi:chromate transporter